MVYITKIPKKKHFYSVFNVENSIYRSEGCHNKKMLTLIIKRNDVNHQLNILIDKSPGPDNIHPRVLPKSPHVIDSAFTLLFHKCLKEGVTPTNWCNNLTYLQEGKQAIPFQL